MKFFLIAFNFSLSPTFLMVSATAAEITVTIDGKQYSCQNLNCPCLTHCQPNLAGAITGSVAKKSFTPQILVFRQG